MSKKELRKFFEEEIEGVKQARDFAKDLAIPEGIHYASGLHDCMVEVAFSLGAITETERDEYMK